MGPIMTCQQCEEWAIRDKSFRDVMIVLHTRIATLEAALHRDQTGLASALEEVLNITRGYGWATTSRGPYTYDDEEYRLEFGRCLDAIAGVTHTALVASWDLAHPHCCSLQQGHLPDINPKE